MAVAGPKVLRHAKLTEMGVGNQVTPFQIKTVDGEALYAWHILPLSLYAKHEDKVASSREPGLVQDVTTTEAFRLLKEEKDAKVILYCMAVSKLMED